MVTLVMHLLLHIPGRKFIVLLDLIFFDWQGMTIVIKKALYGLASSSARFHDHLADTFCNMGFKPTRFDNDVWIRCHSSGDSYEYICTHVDDFCIFSREPQLVMDQITAVYTVKAQGPPDYYLGNNFKRDTKNCWCIGSVKYVEEAVRRIETMFGSLRKHNVPMASGDHPEMDDSSILTGDMHQKYQMHLLQLLLVLSHNLLSYSNKRNTNPKCPYPDLVQIRPPVTNGCLVRN